MTSHRTSINWQPPAADVFKGIPKSTRSRVLSEMLFEEDSAWREAYSYLVRGAQVAPRSIWVAVSLIVLVMKTRAWRYGPTSTADDLRRQLYNASGRKPAILTRLEGTTGLADLILVIGGDERTARSVATIARALLWRLPEVEDAVARLLDDAVHPPHVA